MSNRNNGRSDDQMKCVYMGPPMRRNPIASLKDRLLGAKKKPYPQSFADGPEDEPTLEEVYMGPPPDEEEPEETAPVPGAADAAEPKQAAEPDPRAMEGVYAGPGMMNRPPMAPVYAGPEMMNDPARDPRVRVPAGPRMEALYAAPKRPDASEMMMVYAGPDYFANKRKEQEQMMLAYAGPPVTMPTMAEQMENARKQAGDRPEAPDYRNEKQNPEDLGKPTVCPGCGASVPQSRFCSECGALLPGSLMVRCSRCGNVVPKGIFCIECGTVFPKEESSPEA